MSDTSQYIVSARKYRPVTFSSVVGQKNLTTTLKNSISSGRLAQAYLFCGPRGVGKTSCARIFARTINCLTPTPDGEACGTCDSCLAISKGNSFNLIELDAASNNSVDDIRNLIEQVNVPPQQGKYKVFIIDEVHMLSSQAFNAFLKTLEEPPKYAIFILATTEKHKVIPTILSRCQIYDFKRITVDDMVEHLGYVASDAGIAAEPKALGVIARKADGAMRDALSIFDQVAASSGGNITYQSAVENLNVLDYDFFFRLIQAFSQGDIPGALLIYKEIRDKGFDSLFFINGLASHIRDLMVAADARTLPLLEVDSDTAESFRSQATSLPLQWYYAAMKILNDCDYSYRTASNKQLLVEVALIRLCQLLKPATPPFDLAEDLPSLRNPAVAPRQVQPVRAQDTPQAPSEPQPSMPISEDPKPQYTHSAHSAPAAQSKESIQPANTPDRPTTQKPKSRLSGRPRTFRLSDQVSQPSTSSLELRDNNFSDQQFNEAWASFIAQHQEQHILTSAMRIAKKERNSPSAYTILVEHPAQVQAFEGAMPKLLEFLRNHLQNDHLILSTKVDKSVEITKPLPPQEFLKKIVTENPAMGEFLQAIDAEMA